MNNDSLSTPAADLPTLPPPLQDRVDTETVESVIPNVTTQDVKTPAQKRAQVQTKKKNEFLASLLENLDTLIYMELCVLYYMDCSLFRLLIRVFNQVMYLTPKPNFIPSPPQNRPYLGAIFAPNIICILLHMFTARPEAGEVMRGYLHGGVIVDLIGQKGPTSKISLVLSDILVLVLQCVMLTVHLEKENLPKVMAALTESEAEGAAVTSDTQPRQVHSSIQDLDAEERGMMRHGITDSGEIELTSRSDTSPLSNVDKVRNEEHDQLLAEPTQQEEDENQNPLDIFYTESSRFATFHVLHALRRQWEDYGTASGSALQTVGFSAEFARVAASRRLNATSQRLQRQADSLGN